MILERQWLHVVGVAALLAALAWADRAIPALGTGAWLGPSTRAWVAAGVLAAIAHHVWVVLWWRLELHRAAASRVFGDRAFRVYAVGFVALAFARIGTTVAAGIANRDSVPLPPAVAWPVAVLLLLPPGWLLLSIARYFTFTHALGADHFFPEHRERPLCREGIFRYVPNAMYTVGAFVLWAPAIACASWAALALATFNHAYLWVHYYALEKPDMARIYG
jgi:hypothetical protein